MPRRITLTGRINRRDNLRNVRNNRRRNEEEFFDNLDSTYKIALTLVPRNFRPFSCGTLSIRCSYCRAKHFMLEVTNRDNDSFMLCCHKGKVTLQNLSHNAFFENLYRGIRSDNEETKQRSKNYFENIRSFNASFAMVSSEANISDTTLRGIYHFKIHGVFYHKIGSLSPENSRPPSYAQLYFYDVDTANQFRMGHRANQNCDPTLMMALAEELNQSNPFIQSFKSMAEYCRQPENRAVNVSMIIKVNPNTDIRRFNDAVQTDVAAIFKSVDGEPPFDRNLVVFSKHTNSFRWLSVLDPSLDPLAYPLLFPNGDQGWHTNIRHNRIRQSSARTPQENVTMLQYASYRLAIRDEFSLLHVSQKLLLQWVVDMYVRMEGTRLHFIRQNQRNIRAEVYYNLVDFLHQHPNETDEISSIGRKIILPSSFIGSPRNMYQNYLDAMSIVQQFGKPSLFVTMTCNPQWPEIVDQLDGLQPFYRPDIIVRVFKCKLKELIDCITKKKVFGHVDAIIYTIEFQKRGLPHAHILITLNGLDRVDGVSTIDKIVCAEIPNIVTHPMLHEAVKRHMIHGPCGGLNPNSVCMKDGKCSKNFPKDFCNETRECVNGYPVYRRRDNDISVEVRGSTIDNRFVVPYNPYLLAKFNCHLNVEVCTTVKSIKYIYKYVYKGYDSATVQFHVPQQNSDNNNNDNNSNNNSNNNNNNNNSERRLDEIESFVNGRYVGSTEAVWRIFEFPMHFQSHNIIRLDCHLPNHQIVYFREGSEHQAASNPRRTKLVAFFELNIRDSFANQFLYTEIPMHYTWNIGDKKWNRRARGGDKVISRLYVVSPKNIELFHLRLLLLHVRGPKSFEDLKVYGNIEYPSFTMACLERGIASNDEEWRDCLNEVKEFASPSSLRELFGVICALNTPSTALDIWNQFKIFMSEDYLRRNSEEIAYNLSLLDIERVLNSHNVSCQDIGLPIPTSVQIDVSENPIDLCRERGLFEQNYSMLNNEQRVVVDVILREVLHHDTGSNVYCLTALAGCGKTFVQTTIIHKLNSLLLKCVSTAFSGIASTLLIGGRTLHNVFKLPIPILENSVSRVTPNSAGGRYLKEASLIIIDEISMCPLQALKVVDKLLRDLASIEDKNTVFGGKTVLLCGDFRQILPVVPHGSRVDLIENCVTSWTEFQNFKKLSLSQNMRVQPNEVEFTEFLMSLGNGELPQFPQFGDNLIEIPQNLMGIPSNIIGDTFGNIEEVICSPDIINSVILAPKNEDCSSINADILGRIPGDEKVYYSVDKIVSDNIQAENDYPVEFLNFLNVSGLPPHKLVLKENCVVILMRNLNTNNALVNGTRLRIKKMHDKCLDCEILTGVSAKKRIFIPRIHMTYSGTLLPFTFKRTQLPVIPAFAMTINKSQGQTFNKVAILLNNPVFSHGQLYVAASRVRSFDNLRFYVIDGSDQGHLANDARVFTRNIVYREVLNAIS